MKAIQRFGHAILLCALLLSLLPSSGSAAPSDQEQDPETRAQALLEQLTPEERVGQLFLVTFDGTDISSESQIYDLIANHHVGGVVLLAENDNFVDAPDTLEAAWQLIRDLQLAESQSAQGELTSQLTGETFTPAYIPLLVGISQEGDGYPYDQILSGLTPQPNAMTLGATWQPELARQAGAVLGQELAALGFNLLFGPSLDVLETPKPESPGDIGTSSYGGDPYWVGEMASAFVTGVHEGSQNRIAVAGKHFPGLGASDRALDEEIPTIRKSLAELPQIDLAPFYSLTGDASSAEATLDALLVSHIRYQGFLGNIRATTRPVSFDSLAFEQLFSLEPLSTWREAGGVVISDDLSSRAVRRYYDPTEETYSTHLVARDAFLAGNDLLYLGNDLNSGETDDYTAILNTLNFFIQKYNEDVAFAQRVDESVLRILTLKFHLYTNLQISGVLPARDGLEDIGGNNQIMFDVSRQAATLFSPSLPELDSALPSPPALTEQMVIITDSYSAQQCSQCQEQEVLAVDALKQAINRLYGPAAGNLFAPGRIFAHSSSELLDLLDGNQPDSLLTRLQNANWIILVMLDVDAERPASQAIRRFLSERADLLQGKHVIAFAFNAPYYLDATDISKLTAYYGLYSKGTEFVEVAARLLFKEITALGASPVPVTGLGYDLITATSPDPEEIIPLSVSLVTPDEDEVEATPVANDLLELRPNDLILIQAGVILDHNNHPVPDNTPVQFRITIGAEGAAVTQRTFSAVTENGIAQASYQIESGGRLEIQATSGLPEASSEVLQYDIAVEDNGGTAENPTNGTVEPTLEVSPTPETPGEAEAENTATTTFDSWMTMLAVALLVSYLAYRSGVLVNSVRWGVRWGLMALLGGLAANSYLSLNLPGSNWPAQIGGLWGYIGIALLGAVLGWAVGWLWQRLSGG